MKSILLIAAIIFTANVFAHKEKSAKNDDEKGNVVAIAKGALKANCDNTEGKLQYHVETVSACFAGGFITKVTFYKTTPCPPNTYCIQMIETIGTVTLGCDNEVINVACGGSVSTY